MRPKSAKWLDDIRRSAEFILQVTNGKTLEDYREDALLRAGVERHFEIIGEAMGRLARDDPETAARISDYPRIIAFRNLLIHGYDLIDHAQVWSVMEEHLPSLIGEVCGILPGPEDRAQ
jgi:uncharacterized protein with HEPN domain